MRWRLASFRGALWRERWTVGSAAAAVVIVAVAISQGGATFRESFAAQLLATLAGILAGVPIALRIGRLQASDEQRAQDTRRREADNLLRIEALRLIRDDLEYNLTQQRKRTADPATRAFLLPFLRDDLWRALSESGDLRLLTDPSLLDALIRAYDYIRTSRFLEERYFEATHYPGMIGDLEAFARVKKYAVDLDPAIDAAIDHALSLVDRELEVQVGRGPEHFRR